MTAGEGDRVRWSRDGSVRQLFRVLAGGRSRTAPGSNAARQAGSAWWPCPSEARAYERVLELCCGHRASPGAGPSSLRLAGDASLPPEDAAPA